MIYKIKLMASTISLQSSKTSLYLNTLIGSNFREFHNFSEFSKIDNTAQ